MRVNHCNFKSLKKIIQILNLQILLYAFKKESKASKEESS